MRSGDFVEWRDVHPAPECMQGSAPVALIVRQSWEVVEKYISAHNTYEYNKK